MTRFGFFLLWMASLPLACAKPNVLLICIDDLRPELNCYGKEYMVTPHIDSLAARGRAFHQHYVQAPTCGASRFTLLTGQYGDADNGALLKRAKDIASGKTVPTSFPTYFRDHGYTTVSVGKVSHHPGGRTGPDWDEESLLEMPLSWDRHLMPSGDWQHPRGAMHGLANGEIRTSPNQMDVLQAVAGGDEIYPDGLITAAAMEQLEILQRDDKPFFLAVGFLRPHLPLGMPKQYLDLYDGVNFPPIPHPHKPTGTTTWHKSSEFMKYHRWGRDPNKDADFADKVRRHYAACVTYADAQVGRILSRLTALGLDQDTVIVLWGDHGWHLGEHAIWGKHSLFEESLLAPLIVVAPQVSEAGIASNAIVEALDIFPTVCELAKLPVPGFLAGKSLLPQLKDPNAEGKVAIAYTQNAQTIRTKTHRLILHKSGAVELYDLLAATGETVNCADQHPKLVEDLKQLLKSRLQQQ